MKKKNTKKRKKLQRKGEKELSLHFHQLRPQALAMLLGLGLWASFVRSNREMDEQINSICN